MKTLVSALILSASFIGAAQAGELDYPPALDTHSSVTRARSSRAGRGPRQRELVSEKKATPSPRSPRPATRPAPRCSKSWLPPVRKA